MPWRDWPKGESTRELASVYTKFHLKIPYLQVGGPLRPGTGKAPPALRAVPMEVPSATIVAGTAKRDALRGTRALPSRHLL